MNISNLFSRGRNRFLSGDDGHIPFPRVSMKTAERLMLHGQVRTLADIAMALNEQRHFSSIDEFRESFSDAVAAYETRGTVSRMAAMAILNMIHDKGKELLGNDGYLDFDKLIRMVDGLQYDKPDDPLNAIYNWREKTKLLRIAAVLNEIMQYTSSSDFLEDIAPIATGRYSCKGISYLNDTFRYPLSSFMYGVEGQWSEITTGGILDNKKLEARMFTDHERKLAGKPLATVLNEDYTEGDICHPDRYYPKATGTAPVYNIDRSYQDHCSGVFGKLTRSCGDGIGPNAYDSLYEFSLVKHILCREVERGAYLYKDGVYYPHDVYSGKPVFDERKGMLRFEMKRDKLVFIINLHNRGRG